MDVDPGLSEISASIRRYFLNLIQSNSVRRHDATKIMNALSPNSLYV